jgi:serine/threonine protein phosphatase PrpC
MTNIAKDQALASKGGSTLKKNKYASLLTLKDVRKTSVLKDVSRSFGKLFKFFGLAKSVEISVNFAQISDRGQREYQQDETHVGETASGAVVGILADGMGGHVSGEVASRLAKEAILECLIPALSEELEPMQIHAALEQCVAASTKKISKHIKKHPKDGGMGTTLIVTVVQNHQLYWISIGDSPLYLWRAKKCYQINQNHSMGPAIDQMAIAGLMSKEEARVHPDRNALTSALNGNNPDLVDSGNEAIPLLSGDIVILSSDGLQIIPEKKMTKVLDLAREEEPIYIAAALLNSAKNLDDPDQDNLAVVAIKMEKNSVNTNKEATELSSSSDDDKSSD